MGCSGDSRGGCFIIKRTHWICRTSSSRTSQSSITVSLRSPRTNYYHPLRSVPKKQQASSIHRHGRIVSPLLERLAVIYEHGRLEQPYVNFHQLSTQFLPPTRSSCDKINTAYVHFCRSSRSGHNHNYPYLSDVCAAKRKTTKGPTRHFSK